MFLFKRMKCKIKKTASTKQDGIYIPPDVPTRSCPGFFADKLPTQLSAASAVGNLVSFVASKSTGSVKRISEDCDITSYTPTSHKNACICMIDIVNFSKWCHDKEPFQIFETMIDF